MVGINLNWISLFSHEEEVLLYNQCLPIQETQTYDDDPQILINHLMHSLQSRQAPITKMAAFYDQIGITFDAEWIPLIMEHRML